MLVGPAGAGKTTAMSALKRAWEQQHGAGSVVGLAPSAAAAQVLGEELGIETGQHVKVSSKRGFVKAAAVVTKRIKPLTVDGKTVHQVGIPLHWGFSGVARNGYLTNTLTPFVGDANTQTPEFKSFLVNVEKA